MQNVMNTHRLLVLDDEDDVAATICMMAETAGFATNHIDDADAFIKKVITWAPTHIVIDLQLLDSDGIEVLGRLAKLRCEAVVIIASGLGGRILDSSARIAVESGLRFAGILSKPFSRSALLALLSVDVRPRSPGHESTNGPGPLNVTRDRLTDALDSGAFIAYFQPKVSCSDGGLVGFECLARWPQRGGGMIPPNLFIEAAEKTGQIHELTRQVYDYALSHLPHGGGSAGLKFALNLSPLNLNDDTFPRWLLERCHRYGIAPSKVILEVTETASMEDPLELLENLTQFRIRGFQLSIDDFGVGYSSLVQLARLPFSELKIDQMFVKSLPNSDESRKIVTAVVGLGKSLELNVVAEGVEGAWALDFLRDIGCDEAQGYFIAEPMSNLAARAWKSSSWGRPA